MANLLLKETKIKMRWMRRRHTYVVVSIAFMIAMLLSAATLLPVIIYTKILKSDSLSTIIGGASINVGAQRQKAKKKKDAYIRTASNIGKIVNKIGINEIMRNIVDDITAVPTVKIMLLSARYTDSTYEVSIAGTADTRDAIVSLKTALENSNLVNIVNFPIANFAMTEGQYNFRVKLNVINHE